MAVLALAEEAPDSAASSDLDGDQPLLEAGPSHGRPQAVSGRRSPDLWEPTADMLADWAAHQAGEYSTVVCFLERRTLEPSCICTCPHKSMLVATVASTRNYS